MKGQPVDPAPIGEHAGIAMQFEGKWRGWQLEYPGNARQEHKAKGYAKQAEACRRQRGNPADDDGLDGWMRDRKQPRKHEHRGPRVLPGQPLFKTRSCDSLEDRELGGQPLGDGDLGKRNPKLLSIDAVRILDSRIRDQRADIRRRGVEQIVVPGAVGVERPAPKPKR